MRKFVLSASICIYAILYVLWTILGVQYSAASIAICGLSVLFSCLMSGVTRKDRTSFEKLRSIESMLFALFMIAVAVCSNYMSSIPEPYGIILYSIFNACVISIFIDRIFRPIKQ